MNTERFAAATAQAAVVARPYPCTPNAVTTTGLGWTMAHVDSFVGLGSKRITPGVLGGLT